jgi:hypothetical protein
VGDEALEAAGDAFGPYSELSVWRVMQDVLASLLKDYVNFENPSSKKYVCCCLI